jgi:hypothetical protein
MPAPVREEIMDTLMRLSVGAAAGEEDGDKELDEDGTKSASACASGLFLAAQRCKSDSDKGCAPSTREPPKHKSSLEPTRTQGKESCSIIAAALNLE